MKKILSLIIGLYLTGTILPFCVGAATLNLNLYIEGYYLGSGQMNPTMFNEGVAGSNPSQCDTIVVELHNPTSPYAVAFSFNGILMTDGTIACSFSNSITGNSYYIAIKHRTAIQTWSAAPVLMAATTSYDFTTAACQAYGCNMVIVDASPDRYAFYVGDVTQDENVDLLDFVLFMNLKINNGIFGYYAEDLNGDGNVDLLDFPYLDKNINAGIFSRHP